MVLLLSGKADSCCVWRHWEGAPYTAALHVWLSFPGRDAAKVVQLLAGIIDTVLRTSVEAASTLFGDATCAALQQLPPLPFSKIKNTSSAS